MLKNTLKDLGMTSNEVEIYLTLLTNGELSVNEIGSKAGLHRQVCYDALERLLEKGFVSYIIQHNKKYFKPLNPEKILDYLESKKQEVTDVLPELQQIFFKEQEETQVEVLKGKSVIKTMLNDIIRTLKELQQPLFALGIDETKYLQTDSIAIQQYISQLKKHNLNEKLITYEGATDIYSGKQSEYRFIPKELFNPNTTHIYGDKIAIIIWGTPIHGIIIKNKQVADANRKYFQMLWGIAKKKKVI